MGPRRTLLDARRRDCAGRRRVDPRPFAATRSRASLTSPFFLRSYAPQTELESGRGIRRLALCVLIYEAIRANVFGYDFAPASVVYNARRLFLNLSQEGLDDLDDLVKGGLIDVVRLSSKEGTFTSAYAITPLGIETLGLHDARPKIRDAARQAVDVCVLGQRGELLVVIWNNKRGRFELHSPYGGKPRISEVTDPPCVSYVSSAYIPSCFRPHGGKFGKQTVSLAFGPGR